jgi:tRNA A-37 threonylcarbamoyl transferase component Bud32
MRTDINPAYGHLKEWVALLPQHFEEGGQLIFNGRNTIKKFNIDGTSLVVKRFRRPKFLQRIVYSFFRKSKAKRAFLNGGELRKRGFDTPVNIAFLETWESGLLTYAYYVCGVDDAPPIVERLDEMEPFDRVLVADLARFAAQLHEKGVLHGDFNNTNVLYHPQSDGHYHFSLIDINRMTFYEGTPPMSACMDNLTRFTGNKELFRWFAEHYAACRHLGESGVEQMISVKNRHDRNWDRRKALLTRLHLR